MNMGPKDVYLESAILILCDLRDSRTTEFVRRMRAAFRGRSELLTFGEHHALLALFPGVPTGRAA